MHKSELMVHDIPGASKPGATSWTWPHPESHFDPLYIVRQNYLVNGHAGVLAYRLDFRKLLDHEQITLASRPHALARGSQPIETTA